jgi:thiamine-phosphate pyrophosphorylase
VILPDPPLLVITDRKQAATALISIATAVLNAGCRWISVREKDLLPAEQVALARELLPIARDFGAVLTLHGDATLARSSGASGVHLPERSDPSVARATLGPTALIGISVHGIEQLRALDPTMVDYAMAGPVYASASKPGYGPALGSQGLRSLASQARIPVVGIAGIEPGNVADVMAAGAPGAHTCALLDALAATQAQLRAR